MKTTDNRLHSHLLDELHEKTCNYRATGCDGDLEKLEIQMVAFLFATRSSWLKSLIRLVNKEPDFFNDSPEPTTAGKPCSNERD